MELLGVQRQCQPSGAEASWEVDDESWVGPSAVSNRTDKLARNRGRGGGKFSITSNESSLVPVQASQIDYFSSASDVDHVWLLQRSWSNHLSVMNGAVTTSIYSAGDWKMFL